MKNLNINKGYKTYSINGDENAVITVKTTDFGIIDRLTKVREHAAKIIGELEKIESDAAPEVYLKAMSEADEKVKAELDTVFDSPVSKAVFGNMNSLSFAGGQPVAVNFIEAILPEITKDLNEEHNAAAEKIGKYIEAAKQFK